MNSATPELSLQATRAPVTGGDNVPSATSAHVIVAGWFSLRTIFGRFAASTQAV